MNWSEYFYYDEYSPSKLAWAVERKTGMYRTVLSTWVGKPAGGMGSHGYYEVKLFGKTYKCHRIIYELLNSKIPDGVDIDHINGDRGDNTVTNLRLIDDAGNSLNRHMRYDNTTGYTGVSRHISYPNKDGRCRVYYYARWIENGKEITKVVKVIDGDETAALAKAVSIREAAILMSEKPYTKRHGKDKNCARN